MFTNKLIKETSPYLLQHSHNPVQWYPWGDEALKKAEDENKIILLSIGYAACHWCHVMERESFENIDTAAFMNTHFVNIKIDREERPDLDHIYMDAVQTLTGSGGWPLNVFLTPQKIPFYGGTYFPPKPQHGRASWMQILEGINNAWINKKLDIETQANSLLVHLKKTNNFENILHNENEIIKETIVHVIFEQIMKTADSTWGGFGKAPKFPQFFTINYLLQYYHFTKNKNALQQALLSIDKILQGGIYDHVGGGIARYSTDEEWLAPHFEKMLYDNALFIATLSDAYKITKKATYKNTIEKIILFIKTELMHFNGGFYAALDADTDGEEGKFYTWDKKEIENILGDESQIFCTYFGVSEKGNWENKNILRTLKSKSIFVKENNLNESDFEISMQNSLEKLYQVRAERTKPLLDDKIILSWNALMITALCKASAALQNNDFKKMAETNYSFLMHHFCVQKSSVEMYHTFKNDNAKYPAFLDDYANTIKACIHLQEITSNQTYLEKAKEITQFVIEHFYDSSNGYFYYTHQNQSDIIVRKVELHDGAIPSGNAIMLESLFYLSKIFDNVIWGNIAQKMLTNLQTAFVKYPTSFGVWTSVFLQQHFGIQEWIVTGNNIEKQRNKILQTFIPNMVLQSSQKEVDKFPLLQHKNYELNTQIYLCKNKRCNAPVSTLEEIELI